MDKFVKADDVKDLLNGLDSLPWEDEVDNMVDNLIEENVVEVVRCKDCEYYRKNEYSPDEDMWCMCWCDWLPTDPNDFCSSGERKII